ncbi:MAG: hypothetical protein CMN84_08870 [Spongiibacteraceae bacterium]|jgi:putative salt-induced outer membrane protein|nr:hypothetical protein [Spongiibacteraceae bacterium]
MTRLTLLALLSCFCASTLAQEGSSPWSGDAELGFVASEGNTDAKSVSANAALIWEKDAWKNNSEFQTLNTESAGVRSAERYFVSNRLSYTFSPHNYLFNYVSWEDDRFSGYKYRATIAFGYGRRIIENETLLWDAEIGPGYRRAELLDNDGDDVEEDAILRMASNFRWELSPTATFEQKLAVDHGEENTVSKSTTSIKTTVAGGVGLKIAYLVQYTSDVPADKVHADKQTTVTLVYSF